MEQVRREIDEHIAFDHRVAVADGERFAADADALLGDPAALGDGALERAVPGRKRRLPAERHAGATVFVVRLEHEAFAIAPHLVRHSSVDHPRPRHVPVDGVEVGSLEQVRVALIGQDGEERLLVRNLAAQVVGHAHRPGAVGIEQRAAFVGARDDVVDQHAPVDEVDRAPAGIQPTAVEPEIARIVDRRLDPRGDEIVAQQLELAPRRHFAPVDDGDPRHAARPAPLVPRLQQRVPDRVHRRVKAHLELLAEPRHHHPAVEHFGQPLAVGGAGRAFAVVFGEFERIGQQEGVGTRRGARRAPPGVDRRQRGFRLAHPQREHQRRISRRHGGQPFSQAPQRLRREGHARLVRAVEEERAQERAEQPAAERQAPGAHAIGERAAQIGICLDTQDRAPGGRGISHRLPAPNRPNLQRPTFNLLHRTGGRAQSRHLGPARP